MSDHPTTLESLDLHLSALEARWEARWDATIPHLATKEELLALRNEMQKWMFATALALFLGLGGLVVSISNHFSSNNTPAAAPLVYVLPVTAATPARVAPGQNLPSP